LASKSQPRSLGYGRSSLATIAVIFVLAFAVLQGAIMLLVTAGRLYWLLEVTASVLSRLIGAAGISVTLSGIQLVMTNHILQIDLDCTGITIAALYVALIVAYPLSARTRLLAVLAGLPAIAIANMLRLFGVALASEYLGAAAFTFAHDYLFKVVMMLVVVGLWAVWLQIARTHATPM